MSGSAEPPPLLRRVASLRSWSELPNVENDTPRRRTAPAAQTKTPHYMFIVTDDTNEASSSVYVVKEEKVNDELRAQIASQSLSPEIRLELRKTLANSSRSVDFEAVVLLQVFHIARSSLGLANQ